MGRRVADRLNRLAKPIPDWIDWCVPVATAIRSSLDSGGSEAFSLAWRQTYELTDRIVSEVHPRFLNSIEATRVKKLEWVNALAAALRKAGVSAPDTTAERTLLIGYYLIWVRESMLLPRDIYSVFGQGQQHSLTWQHVTSVYLVVARADLGLPLLPAAGLSAVEWDSIVTHSNHATVIAIKLLSKAIASSWSPRKTLREAQTEAVKLIERQLTQHGTNYQ